jgi:hypothetical protein
MTVRVMFEPGRIAPTCLAEAYARLVPIRRRPVSTIAGPQAAKATGSPLAAGGSSQ